MNEQASMPRHRVCRKCAKAAGVLDEWDGLCNKPGSHATSHACHLCGDVALTALMGALPRGERLPRGEDVIPLEIPGSTPKTHGPHYLHPDGWYRLYPPNAKPSEPRAEQ